MPALAFPRFVLGILPFLPLVQGCSAGSDDADQGDRNGDHGQPSEQIAFEGLIVPIRLGPLEQRRIPIVVSPPGIHLVRFGLLAEGDGGPNDALLNRDLVETDENGRAEVILTAPSAPTNFSLRASLGSASATVPVVIDTSNEVKLVVTPSYSGGRPFPSWSASVFSGVTCETLEEGEATAERYGEGVSKNPITIDRLPVDSVAVVARVGHYIEGCATLSEVVEGASNRLLVPMNDRPIQLATSELELRFGFETVSDEWQTSIGFVIEAARSAMLNGAADDYEALLDAMQGSLPKAQASAFSSLRSERGWELALAEKFGEEGRDLLRRTATVWMQEGQQELVGADAIRARVSSDHDAKDDIPSATPALMRFLEVGGHAPEEAGFPELAPAVWSADSHDTLLLSGAVAWYPSRLLGALALAPAQEAHPTADTTAEALAFELGCSVVASALITASPGWVYPATGDERACAGTCTARLCRNAIAMMWERATLASGDLPQEFDFSASGEAMVGYEAEAVALSNGSWVGKDRDQTEAATAGGPLVGFEP
jgi:hypothetical protein